ncbi:MAG TPA: RHS repeat-associated core domain-containing protein, partial [Kofleriaceae bacterium]
GDVNGDGVADFVAYAGDGNNPVGKLLLYIRRTSGPRADLLTAVKGDFGPTATVRYTPYRVASSEDRSDCLAPLVCVTRAGFLVSQVDVDNGIASTNVQHHTYASGRADALGWGFLGFKTHTIVDDATGETTKRTFDLSKNTSGPTWFFPFLGMPVEVKSTVVYKSGTVSVTRTTTTTTGYTVQGTGPFMALPATSSSEVTDSNFSGPIAASTTTQLFDAYGNLARKRDIFPLANEERYTAIAYLNDTSNWIIGRPTYKSEVSTINASAAGGTSVSRDTAYTYDALGQLAVQIDNPGEPNNGSFDPLPAQDDGVTTLYTKTTRNGNGLPILVEKLDNLTAPTRRRATELKYDASEGMYVVQTTDPMGLDTRSAYEPGLGVLAAQTDPAGVLTTYRYDTFGRIRADHPAAGGDRVVTYNAPTTGNFGTVDDHRLGQYGNTATLDSLRRTVATKMTGRADGKAVYTETTFDNLGRVRTVTRPHFAGVNTGQTVTTYDKLGRVIQTNGADGSIQTTSYIGRQVTTTNPDGNLSTVTNDSLGRPITSVQATTSGPAGLSGHVTTTTLSYGVFDTLTLSTDTLGNVVRRTYDRLGRLLWKQDRDSRVTATTYDVFGDDVDEVRGGGLVTIVFGGHVRTLVTGGTHTMMTYDDNARVRTKTAPDVGQTFTYDTAYPGKLSSATITGGTSIAYTYDSVGRMSTKKWNGPRGLIGYTYTYDSYNRPATTTYPALPAATLQAPLVVRNVYSGGDIGGQLIAVNDVTTSTPKPYWTLTSTDASEAFSVAGLRNSIETTFGEDPAHPGWLGTITSRLTTTNAQVQALKYEREGAGRVHKRDDTLNGTTETFGYDGLERLTSWSWTGGAGARGAQYVYDDIGNLLQRNITAGPGTNVTYTYGANNFGPHQVSSDGSATAFAYDPQGNQLVAPGRTFTFNSFNKPTSVTATAGKYTMTYDADLARFSRTEPSGQVRYSYGAAFDEYTDTAGTHYVMTVSAAGHPVAEVTKVFNNNVLASSSTNTILVDALGSVDALVGSNGTPESIKYDPFGTRVKAIDPTVRIKTPPRGLRTGFTGHDHDDDVNLIDMIGRVYDPQQQRFLSVDPPAPLPVDGQAYNPYAYVRNNPLNATDPTGYLEVLLGGAVWGTTEQDLYATAWAPGAAFAGYVYGDASATYQGESGTEGPGMLLAVAGDGAMAWGISTDDDGAEPSLPPGAERLTPDDLDRNDGSPAVSDDELERLAYEATPGGTVVRSGKIAIDTDGASRSVTGDATGQARTSLQHANGRSYAGPTENYGTSPLKSGIPKGTIVLLENTQTGQAIITVVADRSPARQTAVEVSQHAAAQLGETSLDPNHGGSISVRATYFIGTASEGIKRDYVHMLVNGWQPPGFASQAARNAWIDSVGH